MSIKHLVDIFEYSTFNLKAYKSYGAATETMLIHLVIDNKENIFEHIIDVETLLTKRGYKEFDILKRFSGFLNKKDLKNIQNKLIEFANTNCESIDRYDGFTTSDVHKHILKELSRKDRNILSANDKYVYISIDVITNILRENQALYNRCYEEVILQLMYDGYIRYYTDDESGYYGVIRKSKLKE